MEVSVGDVDGVTLSVGVLNPVAVWLSERERVRVIVFVVVGSFVGVRPDRLYERLRVRVCDSVGTLDMVVVVVSESELLCDRSTLLVALGTMVWVTVMGSECVGDSVSDALTVSDGVVDIVAWIVSVRVGVCDDVTLAVSVRLGDVDTVIVSV